MQIIVENADLQDINQIVVIAKETLPIYYDEESTKTFLENNNIILKAMVNNNIVGFLLAINEKNNIHIHSIGVDKHFRRIGVGKKLISYLKKYDYSTVTLNVSEANDDGIQFYKKIGFFNILFREDYYDSLDNNNAYLMCLTGKNISSCIKSGTI